MSAPLANLLSTSNTPGEAKVGVFFPYSLYYYQAKATDENFEIKQQIFFLISPSQVNLGNYHPAKWNIFLVS